MDARYAITESTPAEQNSASSRSPSFTSKRSAAEVSAPGSMPQAPAVGAATMRPIAAFSSATASALAVARPSTSPPTEFPESASAISFEA